jgi:hypothetical protein
MKIPPVDPRMTDYLLGRLPHADVESVREEIFASDEAWQRASAAEEELIDSYARGDLDAGLRALVEQRILSSEEGQRKLRMARALHGLELRRRRKWMVTTALAATVTIIVAGLSLWRTAQPPGAEPVRRLAAPVTLVIPLTTERADSTVPTVNLPPDSDADLRLEFRFTTPEPVSSGTAKLQWRGFERSVPASVEGARAVVQAPRRDVRAGPCQIEIRADGRLIAAGSVLFSE